MTANPGATSGVHGAQAGSKELTFHSTFSVYSVAFSEESFPTPLTPVPHPARTRVCPSSTGRDPKATSPTLLVRLTGKLRTDPQGVAKAPPGARPPVSPAVRHGSPAPARSNNRGRLASPAGTEVHANPGGATRACAPAEPDSWPCGSGPALPPLPRRVPTAQTREREGAGGSWRRACAQAPRRAVRPRRRGRRWWEEDLQRCPGGAAPALGLWKVRRVRVAGPAARQAAGDGERRVAGGPGPEVGPTEGRGEGAG